MKNDEMKLNIPNLKNLIMKEMTVELQNKKYHLQNGVILPTNMAFYNKEMDEAHKTAIESLEIIRNSVNTFDWYIQRHFYFEGYIF